MSDAVVLFLVSWLIAWALLMVVYLGLVAVTNHLRARWQQYQRIQRHRRAATIERARIDYDANAAVQRIGAAFLLAHQRLRQETAETAETRAGSHEYCNTNGDFTALTALPHPRRQ